MPDPTATTTSSLPDDTLMALRCRVAPDVTLLRRGDAAYVLRERPFCLLRVTPKGLVLLRDLREGRSLAEAVATTPGMRGPVAIAFLERLADHSLVTLERYTPDSELPCVSVIVPVYNRPDALAVCLDALQRVSYPAGRVEVIVVDDASTDETARVAERWAGRVPVRVVRAATHLGPAACRNLGARSAMGDILAFTDSDCLPDSAWLSTLAAEFGDARVAAAGGAVRPASDGDWLQRYEAVRSPLDMGTRPATVRPRTPVPYLVSANLLVRRNAFLEADGFDPALPIGEDVDLIWRIIERGGQVLYRPAGAVRHDHRHRLGAFLRRRAFYAGSEVDLLLRHPENRRFLVVPLPLVAALACSAGALTARRSRLAPLALLPLLGEIGWVRWQARREGLPLSTATLGRALLRGHGAFLYYAGLNLARYYTLPLAALGLVPPLRRWALATLALAHLGPALADARRLRPRLLLPAFVAAYVLDNLANHAGVVAACVRLRTLAPLALDLVPQHWGGPSARTASR